ncbi:MAG: helicase-related protein [Conexivisphaerales archaeon]
MKIEDYPLIQAGAIEPRAYQLEIANQIDGNNSVVVLPTGLGKTAIAALVIANTLHIRGGKALFLAPTRILVQQHKNFLAKVLKLPSGAVTSLTGEDDAIARQDAWQGRVICATPQITAQDYKRGYFDPSKFSLLIIDEVHRAIGNHSYVEVAKIFPEDITQKIGLTATLPSDRLKIEMIRSALSAGQILYRDYESEDVRPFIQKVGVEVKQLEASERMKRAISHLKDALKRRLTVLADEGLISRQAANRLIFKELIEKRVEILKKGSWNSKFAYTTSAKLFSMLKYLETQTYGTFLSFYERTVSDGKKSSAMLARDTDVLSSVSLIREELKEGKEHPKLKALRDLLSELSSNDRALVFASYRDTVEQLRNYLQSSGIRCWILIGKQGATGQSQDEQIKAVEEFRRGNYQVLIATQIGEEGLDIAECNNVIFYDNVPSAIRFIQRRGRTGRRSEGRMVMLMVKGTSDEAYYWVVQRRIRAMKNYISTINRREASGGKDRREEKGTLDSFF